MKFLEFLVDTYYELSEAEKAAMISWLMNKAYDYKKPDIYYDNQDEAYLIQLISGPVTSVESLYSRRLFTSCIGALIEELKGSDFKQTLYELDGQDKDLYEEALRNILAEADKKSGPVYSIHR